MNGSNSTVPSWNASISTRPSGTSVLDTIVPSIRNPTAPSKRLAELRQRDVANRQPVRAHRLVAVDVHPARGERPGVVDVTVGIELEPRPRRRSRDREVVNLSRRVPIADDLVGQHRAAVEVDADVPDEPGGVDPSDLGAHLNLRRCDRRHGRGDDRRSGDEPRNPAASRRTHPRQHRGHDTSPGPLSRLVHVASARSIAARTSQNHRPDRL